MKPIHFKIENYDKRILDKNSKISIILDHVNGAKNLAMGIVKIESKSSTPYHCRDVEEVIYVLEGESIIKTRTDEYFITTGETILIPAGIEHCHINNGVRELKQIYIFSPQGPEKELRKLEKI